MNALSLFRSLVAQGIEFQIGQTEEGDISLGIAGEIDKATSKRIEKDPESLAAVVLEHLPELTPGIGDSTPVRVMFMRAKDGLVARWKTERGQVRISEVADPDRKKRGKDHG